VTIERPDQVWSADTTYVELRRSLGQYFAVYNHARQRQALGYRVPAAVYAIRVSCDLGLSLRASEG